MAEHRGLEPNGSSMLNFHIISDFFIDRNGTNGT